MASMARRSRPSKRGTKTWWLVASLVITFAVTLIVGLAMTDSVVRWVFLQRLQSDVPEVQREGMVYVCRKAAGDADLRKTLKRMLLDSDDESLRAAIVESLRCAGVWGPDFGEAWLAQLARTAEQESVSAKVAVAITLAETAMAGDPLAMNPTADRILGGLLRDDSPIVRILAMRARVAAGLPVDEVMVDDPTPAVAEQAKLLRSMTDDDPATFVPDLPTFAPYAARSDAEAPWRRWLDLKGDDPQAMVTRWRAVLAVPLDDHGVDTLAQLSEAMKADTPEAVAAAAVSRFMSMSPAGEPLVWEDDPDRVLVALAMFEAARPGAFAVDFSDDMPDLVRVFAVRAAKDVHEIDLLAMFDTTEPTVRRLAVQTAYDRLDEQARRELADRLCHTFDDSVRIAGAMLAGLNGQTELLAARLEREREWAVTQYLRLGQMMAGMEVVIDADALIAREDIDELDVVWAMLHTPARRKQALAHLLDPLTGSSDVLRSQLDQQRFWLIAQRYLPADVPPFWVWADPALQKFQCDVLRMWFLVHASTMN
jgi:hypothetical protein